MTKFTKENGIDSENQQEQPRFISLGDIGNFDNQSSSFDINSANLFAFQTNNYARIFSEDETQNPSQPPFSNDEYRDPENLNKMVISFFLLIFCKVYFTSTSLSPSF